MFGYSIETIYLTVLIVIGCCTVVYLLFADIADASMDGIPFFDPAVILSFITITAAIGYIFERFVNLFQPFLLHYFITFYSYHYGRLKFLLLIQMNH